MRNALNLSVYELKADVSDDHLKYDWLLRNDDDDEYVKAYMDYLHTHLKCYFLDENSKPRLKLVDVHLMRQLLDVNDDRLPFALKGTTDALIMEEGYEGYNLQGVSMLIEVKKESLEARRWRTPKTLAGNCNWTIGCDWIAPTRGIACCAAHQSDDFCWFGERGVIRELNLKHPSNAFAFIGRCVAKAKDGETDGFQPSYVEKSVKRRKLLDVIPEGGSGLSCLEEIMEQYRSRHGNGAGICQGHCTDHPDLQS